MNKLILFNFEDEDDYADEETYLEANNIMVIREDTHDINKKVKPFLKLCLLSLSDTICKLL